MLVLIPSNNKSSATAENTDRSLSWGPDNDFQGRIATMLVQNSCVPSGIHPEKVYVIRRQLADGAYDMDKRLDAALERLFEKLNA